MKTAAIYARVSSDKQKEENTIASQTAALNAFAAEQGYAVPTEWIFEDEGYSGASLIRPSLERVRDLAAEGELDAVLVYAPDRLSRRYAYQILLIEELGRAGVETLFIRSPRATTAEDQLLLQFQGMIAEYERAQILERSRRDLGDDVFLANVLLGNVFDGDASRTGQFGSTVAGTRSRSGSANRG